MCQFNFQNFACGHRFASHLEICDHWKGKEGSELLPSHLCPSFRRIEKRRLRHCHKHRCQTCANEDLAAARPASFSPESCKWADAIALCDEVGGATAQWQTGAILNAPNFFGFMVGGVVHNNHSIPRWSRDKQLVSNATTALDIEAFVQRPEHQLLFHTSTERLTVGLWIFHEKDKAGRDVLDNNGMPVERLYIDISQAFGSQYRAVAMAIARRELAIFMITPDYKNNTLLDTSSSSNLGQALREAIEEENLEIGRKWRDGTPQSRLGSPQSDELPEESTRVMRSMETCLECVASNEGRASKSNSPDDGFDEDEVEREVVRMEWTDSGVDMRLKKRRPQSRGRSSEPVTLMESTPLQKMAYLQRQRTGRSEGAGFPHAESRVADMRRALARVSLDATEDVIHGMRAAMEPWKNVRGMGEH